MATESPPPRETDASTSLALDASNFARITVAPFAILRIAGLPADVLTSFVSPDLSASLDAYAHACEACQACRSELVGELERLVPLASDNGLRNALIRFKRDIYNGRSAFVPAIISGWLQSRPPAALFSYWEALKTMESAAAQLDAEVDDAPGRIDRVLAECWTMPEFQQGVSAGTPSLPARVGKDWASPKPKKRRAVSRSLFAYTIRAAAKTSPFSTFTSNCILPLPSLCVFDGTTRLRTPAFRILTESRLNRSVVAAIRNALLGHRPESTRFPLQMSPHVSVSGRDIFGFGHRSQLRQGGMWLEQHRLALTIAPVVGKVLAGLPPTFCWAEAEQALVGAGLSAAAAGQTLRVLSRADVIRFVLGWDGHCAAPADHLASELTANSRDDHAELAGVLRWMERSASVFSNENPARREELIFEIKSRYQQTFEKLSLFAPPEIRTPVYEDALALGVDFQPGRGFRSIFERLGRALDNKIHVSSAYLWLRSKFIRRYGMGGICKDVAGFIGETWNEVHELPAFSENVRREKAGGEGRFADIPLADVEVPISLYAQIAGRGDAPFEDPASRLVLNMAYSRIGWQSIRVAKDRGPLSNSLPRLLNSWITEVSAPCTPVAIPVSAEASALQAFPRCLERSLALDGWPSPCDLRLQDVVLRHDDRSRLLNLEMRDGTPLRTNYLGGAVPMVAWGPRYLAILLGEPFEIGRPSMSQMFSTDSSAPVRRQERLEEEGCVILRASWWITSAELLSRFRDAPHRERLVQGEAFRKEFEIPRFTYAKGQITTWDLGAQTASRQLKPMWMDFHNVACLEQLVMMAEQGDHVRLMEALPGPGENILSIAGRERVSEFLFEAVLRGRA